MNWQFLLITLGVVCAVDALIHIAYALIALRHFERQPLFRVPEGKLHPDAEPIAVPTVEGITLRGHVVPPPGPTSRGVIVFCPETAGGHESAMHYAEGLQRAGYTLVSFDFASTGESDRRPGYTPNHWPTRYEVADIEAVLDFVLETPQFSGLPIGLYGVSRGAATALAAGAKRPDVRAILAQGAYSTRSLTLHHVSRRLEYVVGRWSKLIPSWHVRGTIWLTMLLSQLHRGCRFAHVERLLPRWRDRDVLFICGGSDSYVPASIGRELCLRTGHDPAVSRWIVPGAKHNGERGMDPDAFDRRVVNFFETAFHGDTSEVVSPTAVESTSSR